MWETLARRDALLVPLIAALLASACGAGGPGQGTPEGLPKEFVEAVEAAQAAGVEVYWLGESFEAGGLTFRATGARFEEPQQALFVSIYYQAEFEGGGSIGTTLRIYSAEGWAEAMARVIPTTTGGTRQDIMVRGWPGQLFSIPVGRWINQLVVVEAPGAVIVADGGATISNFRQTNPLNNPDVLIQVLEENLRPYPE